MRRSRRGAIWTESASYRPQRRRGIDLTSYLLLPVVDGRGLAGIVVCERRASRAFDADDLAVGLHAAEELVEVLAGAGLAHPVGSPRDVRRAGPEPDLGKPASGGVRG